MAALTDHPPTDYVSVCPDGAVCTCAQKAEAPPFCRASSMEGISVKLVV